MSNMGVRQMLLELGTPRYLADMAIYKTWMLPGTTDPDDAATIEIIKAIQRGYRKLGYKSVLESGVVDAQTARALRQISGPHYMQLTWVQIIADTLNAVRNPKAQGMDMKLSKGRGALGSYFNYDGEPPGPLPGYRWWNNRWVTPPGPLGDWTDWLKGAQESATPPKDKGITLSYGPGKSNPNNMAPANAVTKAAFQKVQREINRLGTSGRISEDGIIGSATVSALKKTGVSGATLFATNTATVARHAVTIAYVLEGAADAKGVATNANQGSRASSGEAPQYVANATQANSMAGGSLVAIMGQAKKYAPWLLLVGGVALGAAYLKKNKGKKRKRS